MAHDRSQNEYPKMLYHEDGRTQVVHSQEEESGLEGFQPTPSDAHRNPTQLGAARMAPRTPNDELIEKIRGLFEEFMGTNDDKSKRGPGRPRKDSDNG